MENKISNYLMYGGILAGAISAGLWLGEYSHTPWNVYTQDLNGDNKQDIIIEQQAAPKVPFIQQEDGTYKRLDKIMDAQRDSLEESFENKRKSIENKLNSKE
mgnify:CR=1 FL=1